MIGTAALEDPGFAAEAVRRHGSERVAVALDIRDGLAVGHGWVPGAPGTPLEAALDGLVRAGIRSFVVTAIARDGLLGGPDLALLQAAIARAGDASVIASGGVSSVADLESVRAIGCSGAIVGRALYEGRLDLRAAVIALAGQPATTER